MTQKTDERVMMRFFRVFVSRVSMDGWMDDSERNGTDPRSDARGARVALRFLPYDSFIAPSRPVPNVR